MRIDRVKFIAELTRQNLTQKKLAELSGVSRSTISYIKAGKSCSNEIGQKISKALGVNVDEILED